MKVKSESEVAQSCPTLRYPMDCSLPDSSVHGSFQARVLEWGAIAFSKTQSNREKSVRETAKYPSNCQGPQSQAKPRRLSESTEDFGDMMTKM